MSGSVGISVVVLSYERLHALRTLLRGLLRQDLRGIDLEVIVCNNSSRVRLARSRFSRIGRLLRQLPEVKVFDSSHNWLCRIRYTLATLARHDTILFLDDDIVLKDVGVVRDMYEALAALRPVDIVSCWTALWTDWTEDHLTKVRMSFVRPEPTELTECDYVGPGISMFRREILLHPGLLELSTAMWRSDSSWFPWLTAMQLGSRKYYLPCHGRVGFHWQHRKGALDTSPGFRDALYSAYKQMWKRGYTPVLSLIRHDPSKTDSPEMRAARTLPAETTAW